MLIPVLGSVLTREVNVFIDSHLSGFSLASFLPASPGIKALLVLFHSSLSEVDFNKAFPHVLPQSL